MGEGGREGGRTGICREPTGGDPWSEGSGDGVAARQVLEEREGKLRSALLGGREEREDREGKNKRIKEEKEEGREEGR